jgi:hypothetical protein
LFFRENCSLQPFSSSKADFVDVGHDAGLEEVEGIPPVDLAFNLSGPLDLGARIGDDRPRSSPMSRQVSVFPDHRPLHVPAVGESATCSRGNHNFVSFNLFLNQLTCIAVTSLSGATP